MSRNKITEVLSAGGWEEAPLYGVDLDQGALNVRCWRDHLLINEVAYIADEDRSVLAALALYKQPFGFTREDVAKLRSLAAFMDMVPLKGASIEEIRSIAVRIEALLPPE